jgi:hypothetical protein
MNMPIFRRAAIRALAVMIPLHVLSSTAAAAGPYRTQHVFFVAIDGIRNHEAFESGNLHIPRMWDSLRPLGAIYTEFRDRGITVTNAGHSTIATGVHQMLPNNSGIPTPVRPLQPTMGEYYRRQRGVPATATYEISGKTTIWRYPASLYPGYGYPWAPTITLTSSTDTVTWDSTRVIMQRDHPSLVYVLFAQVDKEGHTADTVKYLSAIRRVDSLVYLLWQAIQGDSVYRDRTTMIVSSDHGRHDETHGGWQAHGDYCHGCRHIPFLAIGPDITPGRVFTRERCQLDIVPTIAALLDFQVPLAEGTVMEEMLMTPPPRRLPAAEYAPEEQNLSRSSAPSRAPAIGHESGRIHVVYSEGEEGERSILLQTSDDDGATWSDPFPVLSSPEGQYVEPAIAVEDSLVIIGATGWTRFADDSTSAWILEVRRSTDAGATWGAVQRLDTLGTISSTPSIAVAGNRVSIVANAGYAVWCYRSTDYGTSYAAARAHTASSTTPVCALRDTTTVAAWRHLNADVLPFWNILADRTPWRTGDHAVTANDTATYSYAPGIAAGRDTLTHLVYVHLTTPDLENRWDLIYRSNPGLGDAWNAPLSLAPGRNAFSPRVHQSATGRLHVVWEDEEAGQRGVWGVWSTDHGGVWSAPRRYSTLSPWACRPAFTDRNDTLFVVWQDLRDGNWEVRFMRVPLGVRISSVWLPGWNLVSLPALCGDASVQGLFPGTSAPAYEFGSGGYAGVDTLSPGRGYWVKVPEGTGPFPPGTARWSDTLLVSRGWNLLGTLSDPVQVQDVTSIPPGLLASPFFGFTGDGYRPVTVLEPGRAYWANAADSGRVVMGWHPAGAGPSGP